MAARLASILVIVIVGATLIAGLIVGAQREDNSLPVDVIIHNAKVYQADDAGTIADAVAIGPSGQVVRFYLNEEMVRQLLDEETHMVPRNDAAVAGLLEWAVEANMVELDLQTLWIQNITISMGLVNTTTLPDLPQIPAGSDRFPLVTLLVLCRTSHMASRVFGYCRVSTTEQADEGASLAAQQQQITGYCMMKGWQVAEFFVERAVSGSVPLADRPEGQRLLAAAGKGDIIVTAKLDRAFRSAADALAVLEEFKDQGIALHMIDLGGDVTGNGISKMVFTILAAVAEGERDRITGHVSRHWWRSRHVRPHGAANPRSRRAMNRPAPPCRLRPWRR